MRKTTGDIGLHEEFIKLHRLFDTLSVGGGN